jgi:hypothetical protein
MYTLGLELIVIGIDGLMTTGESLRAYYIDSHSQAFSGPHKLTVVLINGNNLAPKSNCCNLLRT